MTHRTYITHFYFYSFFQICPCDTPFQISWHNAQNRVAKSTSDLESVATLVPLVDV